MTFAAEKEMKIIEENLILFFKELFSITVEMSPYIMLGFLFAGILHVVIRQAVLQKYFGQSNLKSVIYAALFGVPMPLCSCGVIPTGVSFYQHGASKGSTVSFLISTPQTGIDSFFATYSLIGLPFAIIRVIVAFVSGILGGIITNVFDKTNHHAEIQRDKNNQQDKRPALVRIFQYAFIEFLQDIAKWLVIGLLLAALISVIVPPDFFEKYIGNQWIEMIVVLMVSVPLYICATGSVPVAAVLMMKGLSPGAALVFLMAGPATNAATLTVLGKSLGRKTLILYLISIIGSALFFGSIINIFFGGSGLFQQHFHHVHQHEHFNWLQITSGIVFTLLTLNALALKYRLYTLPAPKERTEKNEFKMDKLTVIVKGMTCNHCKANVENNLKNIEGIDSAEADIVKNTVILTGNNIDLEKVGKVISQLGYEYAGPK